MLNREISPIEIFPLFTQFHEFFVLCIIHKSTHYIHILCFVLQARDFPLKCFLAIGRKFGIVFMNLDLYIYVYVCFSK